MHLNSLSAANLNLPESSRVWCSFLLCVHRVVYCCLDNSQIQCKPQLPDLERPYPGTLPTLYVDLDNRLRDGVFGRLPRGGKQHLGQRGFTFLFVCSISFHLSSCFLPTKFSFEMIFIASFSHGFSGWRLPLQLPKYWVAR